jgi:hypothetical protein
MGLAGLRSFTFVSGAIFALCSPASARGADIAQSHCSQSEEIIFSCKIGSKMMSVCSSKSLVSKVGYLQYRFGRLGALEFTYPRDIKSSIQRFKLSHYFRAKVDRWELSFENKDMQYRVFSYLEEEERPPMRQGGISISRFKSAESSKSLYCSDGYADHLERLEGIVQAAPETPPADQ